MFVGHYAPALAIKAVRPKMSLGLLFVAVQLLDIVWGVLVLLDVEKVRIIPGFTATNPLDLYFMPYTHGLPTAGLWALGAMLIYRYLFHTRPWGEACLLGLAVVSHWLLDLLVHVEDLPLYGNSHKVGLGLWNYPLTSLAIEIGPVLAAAWFMQKRLSASGERGLKKPALLCLAMVGVQLYSVFAPIPSTPHSLAMTTLPTYGVLAALAWWAERYRPVTSLS
ncbi:hypothetical protein NLM33_42230 [Bradyrhizobium sp. CCGUVB1N3]|uniref:hypothetical protein n=1 Tax=Bradyrhizobium sp. CCGUVB1N3 TaxID=2949629 RepID=UPI0020B3D46B|nr:hypothetical protein [Bradyrhizobium sp. CCGUVB1N3]MCP3476778.1 hypothetical protein [Bradyrhizobium sp. CCGUVB1N3]